MAVGWVAQREGERNLGRQDAISLELGHVEAALDHEPTLCARGGRRRAARRLRRLRQHGHRGVLLLGAPLHRAHDATELIARHEPVQPVQEEQQRRLDLVQVHAELAQDGRRAGRGEWQHDGGAVRGVPAGWLGDWLGDNVAEPAAVARVEADVVVARVHLGRRG